MKKTIKILSLILSVVLMLQVVGIGASANADYTIISPYADVVWNGENAWGAYKGTLHSHTTYSDADTDLATMVKGYYERGFDFLANAEHGITGVEWNKAPENYGLYFYQPIIGNKFAHLTDEEFKAILDGSYPVNGSARGKGMTCVTGANEFGCLTLTKSHVNGYFLPTEAGFMWDGGENSFEEAVKYIDEHGGLSHINHPGDWLESNQNPDVVNDPESISFFGDIILKYDSCLGTEVLNERNGPTNYDRILWDNLLMYCLPYGKNVLGYSNTDAHETGKIDTSYMVFMMEENNVENIKKTMQSGAFFSVTRLMRNNPFEIGPAKGFDYTNTDKPYPMFSNVIVKDHSISVNYTDAKQIQWIANGKVIAKEAVNGNGTYTLNLDSIEGAEDFLYVRAEILGDGGMCLTQAFVIDDGTAPETFEEKNDITTFFKNILFELKSLRIYVVFQELVRLIKDL